MRAFGHKPLAIFMAKDRQFSEVLIRRLAELHFDLIIVGEKFPTQLLHALGARVDFVAHERNLHVALAGRKATLVVVDQDQIVDSEFLTPFVVAHHARLAVVDSNVSTILDRSSIFPFTHKEIKMHSENLPNYTLIPDSFAGRAAAYMKPVA